MKTKNPELAGGLKVAANSAAFGIFCQLDVKVFGFSLSLACFFRRDELSRLRRSEIWEQPSEFYCPVIASLVTGGSHLLCAMVERAVRDMGGQIAAMDTDSAMIVSTKDGGLVPCAGGPHKLANYQAAERECRRSGRCLSLRWISIRERFEPLNPWRDTLKTPIPEVGKRKL